MYRINARGKRNVNIKLREIEAREMIQINSTVGFHHPYLQHVKVNNCIPSHFIGGFVKQLIGVLAVFDRLMRLRYENQ